MYSQAHPLPKRVMAASVNFDLNVPKELKPDSMAASSLPDGCDPAFGFMHFQNNSWL